MESLFADVVPLDQDDGPNPVVRIAYSTEFTQTMGYFRSVLVSGEFSERTLLLSAEVISHNAANYTAWQYRRRCLDELHKQSTPEQRLEAWRQELCFCDEQCRNNMKNYQVGARVPHTIRLGGGG